MLLVMVESVLFLLLLVLAILLVANPIQAKPVEDQRTSSNASTVITPNVQTLPRTFIPDSSLLANAKEVKVAAAVAAEGVMTYNEVVALLKRLTR
jgi:hypothetical protein